MQTQVNELNVFLEGLTYGTHYIFLEEGRDDEELRRIGKDHGLSLPSKDLAVFKGIFAFIDEENKNGCTLPEEEVEKSLHTLAGKAIDIDHYRKHTIGFWITAELKGRQIISYGALWKSNFSEEFDELKRLLEEDKLKISFEAWGDRIYKTTDRRKYDLSNIEWAGGALLVATQPAFAGAKVLEMAKEMVAPKTFVYERGSKEDLEEARLDFFYDTQFIARICFEQECPSCKEKGLKDILNIDFENMNFSYRCGLCQGVCKVDLTPNTVIKKKGKRIEKKPTNIESKGEVASMLLDDIKKLLESDKDDEIIEQLESFDIEESKVIKCPHCNNDVDVNMDIQTCPKCLKSIKAVNKSSFEDLDEYLSVRTEGEDLISEDDKSIEEAKKISYKERKSLDDEMFAVVMNVKNKKTGAPRKIRMFPIHDPAHVRNALARLAQPGPQATLRKLGVSVETVKKKVLRRAKQLNMKDLLARHKEDSTVEMENFLKKYNKASAEELIPFLDAELDTIKASITAKDTEISTLKTESETSKKLIDEANVKITELTKAVEQMKTDLDVAKKESDTAKVTLKAKEDAEKAALIKSRKDSLGDFAKDMSDEDILNDLKYENATLKKALVEKKPELAKSILEVGSKDKQVETDSFKTQDRIQAKAFLKK